MTEFREMPFDRRIDALVKLLTWVEQQIVAMIAAMVERGVDGTPTLMWVRKRKAIVDAMLDDAQRRVNAELPALFTDAYAVGLHMAGIKTMFGPGVDTKAIDLLAEGLQHDIDVALVTVGRRVDDLFRRLTLKSVALHIVAGTGAKAGAQQLERALVKQGVNAFVDKAGRRWSLANYAEMAIRTVTREAVSQGTVMGLETNNHELVKFSHHKGSCPLCLPFDGRTFALPGHTVAGYQTLKPDEIPPIHPRCRHVVGPAPARFDQLEQQLLDWKARAAAA